MQWYYALNGQRQGPVTAAEFTQLVQSGIIRADTLVWRQGMASWQPYGEVAATAGLPPPGDAASGSSQSNTPEASPTAGFDPLAASPARTPVGFEFTGNWKEYFKIWIVNVLLTIVTFGIYAAWAKVRKKRYFYSNTRLFGHAFEYLGDPAKILIGNLIVVALFFGYSFLGAISPLVQVPFMLLFAVAVPWIIVRAFRFNARNSAWRGLRFDFVGTYGGAATVYILLAIALPFTLGLLYPYVVKERKKFMIENHRFGTTSFAFHGETGEIFKIYLIAGLFFAPLIVAYFVIIGAAAAAGFQGGGNPSPEPTAAMGIGGLLLLGAMPLAIVGALFLRARMFTYVWNQTTLGLHEFKASMRARDLIGVQVVNSLVTAVTFGLLYPWAAVRMVEFQLKSIQVVPQGHVDDFVASSQPVGSALGEAAGDFFDFDLGFGV